MANTTNRHSTRKEHSWSEETRLLGVNSSIEPGTHRVGNVSRLIIRNQATRRS